MSDLQKLLEEERAKNAQLQQIVQELQKKLSTSSSSPEFREQVFKNHPVGNCKRDKVHDIAFVYSTNGVQSAEIIKENFQEKGVKVYEVNVPDGEVDFNPHELEENLARSVAIVVLLSKDSLKQGRLVFAMETAITYGEAIRPILVHDVATCYFPHPKEQPSFVQPLFAEKAVTFLRDYSDSIMLQIYALVDEKQKELQSGDTRSHHGESPENIQTDMFLSHRRLTAQTIAGRLYEGFKKDFKIFLDSEAQFKIHDLEMIVNHTEIFVLILSEGYLDSEWCLKELKAAYEHNRKIIVIRDYRFDIPSVIPAHVSKYIDPEIVRLVLLKCPQLVWMAEFNTQCIEKMRNRVGKLDRAAIAIPNQIQAMLQSNNFDIDKILAPLDLPTWFDKKNLSNMLWGLKFQFGYNINNLDQFIELLVKAYPSVTKLNFEGCKFGIRGARAIVNSCKNLVEINVKGPDACTNAEVVLLTNAYPNLTSLNAGNIKLTDSDIKEIATKCPKLVSLVIDRSDVTNDGIKHLSTLTELTNLSIRFCSNLNDQGLKNLADSCPKLTQLFYYDVLPAFKDAGVIYLAEKLKGLKKLELPNVTITDASLKAFIENIKSLESLFIDRAKITDAGLTSLQNLTKLRELTLTFCPITDEGLKFSVGCPELQLLHINQTKITDKGIGTIVASCPNLRVINISATLVTDEGIKLLASLKSITHIVFNGTKNFTDKGLQYLADSKTPLFHISMDGCKSITDAGLISLASGCKDLVEVRIPNGSSSNITEASVRALLTGLPKLKKLDMSSCKVPTALIDVAAAQGIILSL